MVERYKDRIRHYCDTNGILVPIGFHRGAASRYAIIEMAEPPKLVARTWFNQADVIHYLEHFSGECPRQILDFKEGIELHYVGTARLRRGDTFL